MSNSVEAYDDTVSFTVDIAASDSRAPEEWARSVFECAPQPTRWFLLVGWRMVLGLRLGPQSSPDHVLGWKIQDRAAESVTLECRSAFLSARQLFEVDKSRLTHWTFVHYDRRIAAFIWTPVSIIHRLIVPRLLRSATSHPARG